MNWRNFAIAVALLAATVTTWIVVQQRQPRQPQREAAPPGGYYLRDAVVEGMSPAGERLYTLRAVQITQQPASGAVSMQTVDLEYSSGGPQPWHLQADAGSINEAGDLIELFGNVRIEEMLFVGPQTTVVTTPELDVDVRAHLATSEQDVRIERGNYVITAVGLRADLKDQKLKLQSEVHGRFLP
ncbi:MAG: LPS export ABC transporter periplasmic protein LptC [Gammaproteobacteria bacterium]|nr:LPS export ABC transporter periplasmic protein LptC [Gammaproteobacteria bacterium]NNM21803.1 LPS export ABC transporter periplasmic protein LptC [Gammaproteobacteria bacterium]